MKATLLLLAALTAISQLGCASAPHCPDGEVELSRSFSSDRKPGQLEMFANHTEQVTCGPAPDGGR